MTKDLKELYWAKKNFPERRAQAEADLLSENNPDNALHNRLRVLREERKAALVKYDYEIAQVRQQILDLGQPTSPTERKRQLADKLRLEKEKLDKEFAEVVAYRMARGDNVSTLAREVGAPNTNFFYNATQEKRQYDLEVLDTPDAINTNTWTYHDFTGTHRYAFNEDMTLVRFHAPDVEDGSSVLTWPDSVHYSGDRGISEGFDKNRAETLAQILKDEYSGVIRTSPNPYKPLEENNE